MALRDDLLNPIDGPNSAGADLRYDPVYDKIREARREEEDLAQGVWQRERKLADYSLVIRLCQEVLAQRSKDLQIAAWLAEALLKEQGFGGFREALRLLRELLEKFWDNLYPELEDGDAELRATPLDWVGSKLDDAVRRAPLVTAGYSFYRYKESREVNYEDQAKTDAQKKTRDKLLKEGKLSPEAFDKAFGETPKSFYATAERELDGCLEALGALDTLCQAKFGDVAPGFGKLRTALEDVRHLVHTLLQKKREIEPDPVEEKPVEPEPLSAAGMERVGLGGAAAAPALARISEPVAPVPAYVSAEPADRREAVASVAAAAAFLRKREPTSPAPYLMLRGLRWGELRASAAHSDPTMLEPPPTDLRRHIKKLALDGKWRDVLEAAENAMALPCSRAWLDLQRFVVEACVALGSDYHAIAIAVRSELKALLRDLPQLLDANLMDDTPAANPETQAWIRDLMAEPGAPALSNNGVPPAFDDPAVAGWRKRFVDPYQLALESLRAGQEQKAFEILYRELDRQRSGRGRFQRKLQLVQLCIATGKDAIAQPYLEDLLAALDAHKLEEWEDREVIASALLTIAKASKKIQGDAKEKQKMFERICRLDPVQALNF